MNVDPADLRSDDPGADAPVVDLVRQAQNGDARATESLFSEHWLVCLRVARRMTGADPDAEDIVQDAFVKALRNLHRFDHRCAFRTWLLRIVTNCATDHLRRRRRKLVLLDFSSWLRSGSGDEGPEPAKSEDPSLPLQNAELRAKLDLALSELSQTTRGAFVLYAEAGMTYQEVSDTLEIPIGTVMSRIHSARKKLRSIFETIDDESQAGDRTAANAPSGGSLDSEDAMRRILTNAGTRPLSNSLTW